MLTCQNKDICLTDHQLNFQYDLAPIVVFAPSFYCHSELRPFDIPAFRFSHPLSLVFRRRRI